MQTGCEWIIKILYCECVWALLQFFMLKPATSELVYLTSLSYPWKAPPAPPQSLSLSLFLFVSLSLSLCACRCCGSPSLVRKQDAHSTCVNMKLNMSSCVCVLSLVYCAVLCHCTHTFQQAKLYVYLW